jgi:hypothetical protein
MPMRTAFDPGVTSRRAGRGWQALALFREEVRFDRIGRQLDRDVVCRECFGLAAGAGEQVGSCGVDLVGAGLVASQAGSHEAMTVVDEIAVPQLTI